jgi:prepilin-type N-terminal cleavage/methylation domain-containing protein
MTDLRHRSAGFTMLEMIAALFVLGILAALLLPNYQRILAAAQQVQCASNMRSIRIALAHYMDDHKMVWPQGPAPENELWAPFWIAVLSPYKISERTWQCPTIRGYMKKGGETEFGIHYIPTTFDATPNIANRWSTQPWLIEMADAHGKGPLICFPDGSVKAFSKVLAEQGATP